MSYKVTRKVTQMADNKKKERFFVQREVDNNVEGIFEDKEEAIALVKKLSEQKNEWMRQFQK